MRQYAIVDTRTRWILSTHSTKEGAEARLRVFVAALVDGTRESARSIAPFLPPGYSQKDLVANLVVYGVSLSATAKAVYTGPFYVRPGLTLRRSA